MGDVVPIMITVRVDEDRLRESGLSVEAEAIMDELAAMEGGRLSLQTGDHWMPVKDMRVRGVALPLSSP